MIGSSSIVLDHQRQFQWALLLPKLPKQLPVPLNVNIPSAFHLHQRPTLPPHPLLQQANPQLRVQPFIHNLRPVAHVMNVGSHFSVSNSCFTNDSHQPSTSMPLTPILHDRSVPSAPSSPAPLSRIRQPSIPHHLPYLKAPKAPQISHIHKSFPTLARILH